jgi:hypothetical protein
MSVIEHLSDLERGVVLGLVAPGSMDRAADTEAALALFNRSICDAGRFACCRMCEFSEMGTPNPCPEISIIRGLIYRTGSVTLKIPE